MHLIRIKVICLIFVFVAIAGRLDAQGLPEEHQFSHEIETKLAAGTLREPSASYYYTFIGDYHSAIGTYDIPIWWGVDTIDISDFRTQPALQRIISEAKKHEVVIISESHLKPQHRIFASKIIDSLSNHGFSYLGIEALVPDTIHASQLKDSILNQRGYPLFTGSGFYSKEPQMANLIRNAIKNGLEVFGYERSSKKEKDRDEIQAENIIKFRSKHPDSKFIILCGWHHAIESNITKKRDVHFMASYLKQKTGIDPLTIYQDHFTEKVLYDQHPLIDSIRFSEPLLFTDLRGNLLPLSGNVDIEVMHPKTSYIKGRPDWLYQDNTYGEYLLDSDWVQIDYPLFFMAFNPGEENDGTPIDIIEIKKKYGPRGLVLKPGRYVIRVDNKQQRQEMDIEIE